jgi:adenylate cyclase
LEHLVTGYLTRRLSPGAGLVADTLARLGLSDVLTDRLLASEDDGASAAGLFAVHLHAAGRFDAAARTGRRALEAGPGDPGRVAYNLACSLARSGDTEAALEWLERAVDLGFEDTRLMEVDSDVDPLRGDGRFQALTRRLKDGSGEASAGPKG